MNLFIAVILLAFVFECRAGDKARDFVEDESGLSSQHEDSADHSYGRFKWKRCRTSSDCGSGYVCHGRWCRPRYMCSINAHCPSQMYCDTNDHVCKEGDRVCKSHRDCGHVMYCKNGVCVKKECHWYRECGYGHMCVSPGLCKLRRGFCTKKSHCSSSQCCLRLYGQRYAGKCKKHVGLGGWCDLKVKQTCGCVQGYSCTRLRGRWGKCTAIPTTPEPTEEPGSGELDD